MQNIESQENADELMMPVSALRELALKLRAVRHGQNARFLKLSKNNLEARSNLLQLSEDVCSLSNRAEGMSGALMNISSCAEIFKGRLSSLCDRVHLLQERISAQSERVSGLSERSSILGDRFAELGQKLHALNVTDKNDFNIDDRWRPSSLGEDDISREEEDGPTRPGSIGSEKIFENEGHRGAGGQGQADRRHWKVSFLGPRGQQMLKLRNRTGFKVQGQRRGRSHLSGSGTLSGGSSRRLLERDSKCNVHRQLTQRDQTIRKSRYHPLNSSRPQPRPDSFGMDNVDVIEID